MAGQWIKVHDHVVDLVKIEFDLTNVNFELVIDCSEGYIPLHAFACDTSGAKKGYVP